MRKVDVFSVRDLRIRTGELLRDAEKGRISLITKHGRPAILALPFDERLMVHGVHKALALRLFESEVVSLPKAAKIADLSVDAFLELLSGYGIPVVTYPPEDLDKEVEAFR